MYVGNLGNTPLHNIDPDHSDPELRAQQRPDGNVAVPLQAHADPAAVDTGLMSTSTPEGTDPQLWAMLGPAERAYLSGGFDRLSYRQGSPGSGMGRGVYVDMRV